MQCWCHDCAVQIMLYEENCDFTKQKQNEVCGKIDLILRELIDKTSYEHKLNNIGTVLNYYLQSEYIFYFVALYTIQIEFVFL